MPKVSVIIPCYNQGQYVVETIQSVLAQTYDDFEIIVVNDGSSDEGTVSLLTTLSMPKTRVLHTGNQGLAAARNSGIAAACGEYILPLDADDTIAADYLEKGVALLEDNPSIGVVYGLADYFGARTGRWELPEYSPVELLSENMIYCSALFSRCDWKRIGGFKTAMGHGWEDWEFWLSLSEAGIGFARIPEVMFHYRVRHASMTSSMTYWQKFLMMGVIVVTHRKLYRRHAYTVVRSFLRSRM